VQAAQATKALPHADSPQKAEKSNKSADSPGNNLDSLLLNNEQKASSSAAIASKPRKLSYKEQRELDTLPAKIEALEAEQKTVQTELQGGQLYGTDPKRAATLAQREAAIEEELMLCLERWEALSASA
jgi:ABC transport system ATP-binding/permease protein